MPRVYKMSITGLKNLIAEEKQSLMQELREGRKAKGAKSFGPIGDVTKVAKKTVEVDADEHGKDKVHEKDLDQYKAAKVHEAKLLLQLKKVRESIRRTKKKLQESSR